MNSKKIYQILTAVVMIIFLCSFFSTVNAADNKTLNYTIDETDPIGDVINESFKPTSDQDPDVDITKFTSEKDEDDIKIELTVNGSINNSQSYTYMVLILDEALTAEDLQEMTSQDEEISSYYVQVIYVAGQAGYANSSEVMGSIKNIDNSTTDGKLTMYVPETAFSNLTDFNVLAIAGYNFTGGSEGYMDYFIGSSDDTDDTGNGEKNGKDNDDEGIPGFELFAFVVALAVAMIILKKKKL
jgi:hypothetical protein